LESARLKSAPHVPVDSPAVTVALLLQPGLLSHVTGRAVARSPSWHGAEQVAALCPMAWGIRVPNSRRWLKWAAARPHAHPVPRQGLGAGGREGWAGGDSLLRMRSQV